MKSPLDDEYKWLTLEEVSSTQDVADGILTKDDPYGVVFALNQTHGRGRHGRAWLSSPGDSLTMSMIFRAYPDHPNPYLIGMGVAIAAARAIHSQLQWPNDLVVKTKKVGGIITEMKRDKEGQLVPIVGLGINLNQETFDSSISGRAVSLAMAFGKRYDAETIAKDVVSHLSTLPEPVGWNSLRDLWMLFDATPGKRYQISESETAIALGIGSTGELICTVNGETRQILAADALFSPDG